MNANADIVQQIVRILMWFGSGLLAKWGFDSGEATVQLTALMTSVITFGWWVVANRDKLKQKK